MKKRFEKNEWRKQKYKNEPWWKTWNYINNRCKYNSAYNGMNRLVKNLLTVDDLRRLWKRDSADKMDKPSIDRIDEKGDYVFSNCRYMELKDNQKRPKHIYKRMVGYRKQGDWAIHYNFCSVCATTKNPHVGNGLCKRCYNKMWRKDNPNYNKEYLKKWRAKNA